MAGSSGRSSSSSDRTPDMGRPALDLKPLRPPRGAMEILDGTVISEIIFKRYARNPDGWSFTVSPSRSHGFYDAVITNAEESWHLKLDTIFKPNPMVLGS